MAAIGLLGDVELIIRWWPPLEEAGYRVEISPSLSRDCKPEKDGRAYRGGWIYGESARVRVIPTSAIMPFSKTPLSGRPALFIEYGALFRSTQQRNLLLAEKVVEVFLQKGMQKLGKPSDYGL